MIYLNELKHKIAGKGSLKHPQLIQSDGSINPDIYFAKRLMVHLHVPKTGGTTMVEGLASIFGKDRIHDLRGNVDSLKHMTPKLRSNIRVLTGHFWFDTYERMIPRRKIYLICLRDPIERFISLYNYVSRSRDHPAHPLYGKLDINEAFNYLKLNSSVEIANSVTNMFANRGAGFSLRNGYSPFTGGKNFFEIARDRMEKSCALVVPMAEIERALRGIAEAFGKSDWQYDIKNRGSYSVTKLSADIRDELLSMNEEDIKLNSYFKDNFESRLVELKVRLLSM